MTRVRELPLPPGTALMVGSAPPKPPEPEILTLLAPHVVVLCSPNFRCGLTPISDPGCPQLKNYYSPIWIAMRWYKARAFMRHHKTSEPRQRRLPIKHKGLIPFSSKLVIQQRKVAGPQRFLTAPLAALRSSRAHRSASGTP